MYKLQICCMIIVLFMAAVYFKTKRVRSYSHIIFSISLWVTEFNLLFDAVTVYTVNHLDTIPAWFNRLAHDLFLGSLILEIFLCFVYSLLLIYNDGIGKRRLWFAAIPVWVAWVGLLVLPLEYIQTPSGNYSWGPAAFTLHGTVAFYIICIMINLAIHRKAIDARKRYVITMAFHIQIAVLIFQSIFHTALISSMAMTLINLAFFLTVESPDMLLMEKLKDEKDRADEANEAKSLFLSNMSHEIRTPMNAIVGMTDILLREELSPIVREYLNNIKNSGDALLTIIDDILDFSKIESGKLEIVEEEYEPMSMLHDVSMIFLNRIGDKDVELLYDIDPALPTRLYGDVKRLRQVVINLMNNAIKFTDSGYVRLKMEVQNTGEKEINLVVTVEDSGQGIREEDLGMLFESFSQVDKKKNHGKEGTGLGLAISRKLVELMNGTIGVDSVYGLGSVFYFTVPQQVVDSTHAARLKTIESGRSTVGYRIVNRYAREQLEKLAKTYGISCVSTFAPGDQVVDFLIADCPENISIEERKYLKAIGTKICILQNPMLESISDIGLLLINKPLYSLNFCQLLNREEQVFVRTSSVQQKFTASKAHVLVVDDNEMNLKVAKGLLAQYKMQIDTAPSGRKAIQMVQKTHYDMVFMDHMMPEMDGIEATDAIRQMDGEYYSKLPIIALTANATSGAKEMFLSSNMDDFIAKPIREKDLEECIRKWLPEEMIETVEVQETESTAEPENSIDGLDEEEGIRNCGSKELFMEILSDFYHLIDPKSAKLEQFLEEGDIRDFTIEVHALKNNARMIGAMRLSELFYKMEQLGNEEKVEEIHAGMPELLDLFRSYKEILYPYAKTEDRETMKVPVEKMQETLMKLHDATDTFDLDAADLAMEELETYEFPEEFNPMLEQLRSFVADVAMEDILRLTQELCDKLSERS